MLDQVHSLSQGFQIILRIDGKDMEIDSRPSDAIALAVRADVPIYAEESVLEKAAIVLDSETGKPVAPDKQKSRPEAGGAVDEEELKRLSAFQDFINTLDLEDLGKKGKS